MSHLRIFIPGNLHTGFSPKNYASDFDLWCMACIYQGINMYNEDLELDHRLSSDVTFTDSYMEVTLKTLFWHDGVKITANDFRFSIEQYFAPGKKYSQFVVASHVRGIQEFWDRKVEHIPGIEILGENLFRVYFRGSKETVRTLLSMPIMPSHLQGDIGENAYIGCGSFKLESYTDRKATFLRNTNFCLGSPQIRSLTILGGTPEEQLQHLVNQTVDFSVLSPEMLYKLPPEIFCNYSVYSLPQPISTVLFVNFKSPCMQSLANRKYINSLLNKQHIVNTLFHGHADVQNQFYPPVVAQKLGCSIIYPDISPVSANISSIRIAYNSNNSEHASAVTLLQKMMEPSICVKISCYSSMREAFDSGADLYISNMRHLLLPHSNPVLLEKQSELSHIKEFSRMLNLYGKLSMSDTKAIKEFAKEAAEKLPLIYLYSKHELQLISRSIENVKPDTRGALWNIHEVYFAKTKRTS